MVAMTDLPALPLDAAAFGRKTAALLTARSEHLPVVADVTALGDRRRLDLDEIDGPTLSELLVHRRRITAGEAVTIVIGVARAVAALHAAGYCSAALGPDHVRLDGDGRPVLIGLDGLRETLWAGAPCGGDDWRAVGALADRLGIVAHGRAGGALAPAQVGLGVMFRQVVESADGCCADCGVEPVVIVEVQPAGERLAAFAV